MLDSNLLPFILIISVRKSQKAFKIDVQGKKHKHHIAFRGVS